jgi:hypothetical protein
MVLAHSRALKTGGNTIVIEADLRDPRAILDHPGIRKLIDFSQPLAVLLVAVQTIRRSRLLASANGAGEEPGRAASLAAHG